MNSIRIPVLKDVREHAVTRSLWRRCALTYAMAIAPLVIPGTTSGQNPQRPLTDTAAVRRTVEQRLGSVVSNADIVERLRDSGLSPAQVRARLQQMGYDPGIADRYFDVIQRGGAAPVGNASATFLEALNRIGIAARAGDDNDARAGRDSVEVVSDSAAVTRPDEVFGERTFRANGRSPFEGAVFGPADPSYLLGPGDQITLILTGDVEEAYPLDVSREGNIFIPNVGQVSVNGLTLAGLQDILYSRLARVYSGVSRSPDATTRFQVSLGALRTNRVFVAGDVVAPGAYQVSAANGLFNLLYQASGPNRQGSFRRIQVTRGGRVIANADLYDFLVRGDARSDIRLEQNDRVFIPPAGTQVRIMGSIRRPAIYELLPHEGLKDLLAFAGGVNAEALMRHVQIDRIVPPAEQRPGHYRRLVDIDLAELANGNPHLEPGDVVHVFTISDERRNRLFVGGAVRNPGIYEWTEGATLWSVIQRADGLSDEAYVDRAHVYRLNRLNGTRELIRAPLAQDAAGRPAQDVTLFDNDSIVIFNRRELSTEQAIAIAGFVKQPGTYTLARGASIRDIILAAGGFTDGASMMEAELVRRNSSSERSERTALVYEVALGSAVSSPNDSSLMVPNWTPETSEVLLQNGDRIFVRRAPGYQPMRDVQVTGEVITPGTYTLATRGERLADVIARAGGLTSQAAPEGIQLIRRGHVVAIDVQKALLQPTSAANVTLVEGDSISVPRYDPLVAVTGAVSFEALIQFVPGQPLSYYVERAGGYADNADRGRVSVSYPNGERHTVHRGWFLNHQPEVVAGSKIFVPIAPEHHSVNWGQVFTRSITALSTLATALFAISQLKKN